MSAFTITIEGISPLLINRFSESSEIPKTMKKSNVKDYGTAREQAEKTLYADEDGRAWIPSSWIKGAISTVSSDYKLPSSRKSVKSIIGGAVIPLTDKVYFEEKYKVKDCEIDSRPVVIQRSRIMRHRAKFEQWTLTCDLDIHEDILPPDDVHQMIGDAGKRAGIGDFRPQKGGPFGRFQIVSWTPKKIDTKPISKRK